MALAVLVLVTSAASSARAETLPLIENVPTEYRPGESFSFDLRVPQLADFAGYNVEILFTTEVLNPPLVAFPTVAQPVSEGGRYVFPTSENFSFSFVRDPESLSALLTFSDSTSPPVQATPGEDDTLVRVTVVPDAELRGPITIEIGAGTTFDFNTEGTDYPAPEPITVAQGEPVSTDPNPVPAPPAALLLGGGALALGVRARLTRRTS
jgi:hypothetical protein